MENEYESVFGNWKLENALNFLKKFSLGFLN